jgi:hypothetical protein
MATTVLDGNPVTSSDGEHVGKISDIMLDVGYASENGRCVDTASPANDNVWCANAGIRDRHYCPGCDGGCVGEGVRCAEWLKRTKTEN